MIRRCLVLYSIDSLFCEILACFHKLGYTLKLIWSPSVPSTVNPSELCRFTIKKHQHSINAAVAANKPLLMSGHIQNAAIWLPEALPFSYEISFRIREDGEPYISIKEEKHSKSVRMSLTSHFPDNHIKFTIFSESVSTKTILIYKDHAVTQPPNRKNMFYPSVLYDFASMPRDVKAAIFSYFSCSIFYNNFISEDFYPPIKVENLCFYHNKCDYFDDIFQVSLPRSANKCSFYKLYYICSAVSYIFPGQIGLLLDWPEENFPQKMFNRTHKKEYSIEILCSYLQKQLGDEENNYMIYEYVDLSIQFKEPIDLTINYIRMSAAFNDLIHKVRIRSAVCKIVIPETPLKYLRLPKEFKLLKTFKALRLESEINHNDTALYAKAINKGKCVFYSADICGEHLTVGICCLKKRKQYKIFVEQCIAKHNCAPLKETLEYVSSQVEIASPAAIEKFKERINNSHLR